MRRIGSLQPNSSLGRRTRSLSLKFAGWGARSLQSPIGRYAVSLIALMVAGALTALIVHFKLPRQIVGYAFLLVIMGSAWWGGYGPGVVTTFVTLLFGPYLMQPAYSLRHPHFANMPQVFLISLLISRMAGARQKLREANERLDERVRDRTMELERVNTSLREREAQLIAQTEKLSQSNADLEQFAYFASHDIQEPLRMIAIYTELLENQTSPLDGESSRYLQVVRESVRRLEVLVEDLLMYSRAIHGEWGARAEVDPQEALRIAAANLNSQIAKTGALIVSDDLPKVTAHPGQLIQIFQNLIGNSIKYHGPGAPQINVSAEETPGECIFSVSDNGIGIHSDYHEKIFVPFKRLHGQQIPGSGVGLAICRRIVERIGGRIWVESDIGAGATFRFSLPSQEKSKVSDRGTAAGA
jgi:signal transduction histidine kinase